MGKNVWARVVQRGILLQERSDATAALLLRNPDGTWELPGGKVEHGETAAESLAREVEEETGLRITDADPVETAFRSFKPKKNRGKFAVVYRCRYEGEDGTPAVERSDEHVDHEWMTAGDVEETNVKQVDEYRCLRRVLAAADDVAERPAIRVATNGSTDPAANEEAER